MKSKPYVLWLLLGGIALAVWLAWPSGKNVPSGGLPGPHAVATPPLTAVPTPSSASSGHAPSSVPNGSPSAPGVVSSLATKVAPSSSTTQATGATASPVNPDEPGKADQTAQIDVGRVRRMISDYHTLMGENPVGTNAEIMKQMIGGNTRQATLGPPEGVALNAQGELVDQWGSPYFFHQLSRDKMEVRSAGPDQVMWTSDDVIAP